MKFFDRFMSWYTSIMASLAGIIVIAIVLVLMANIILRPFGIPIYGIIDVVQLLLLTLIMASLGFVQSTDSHISVDLITERLPIFVRRWFELAAHVLTFLVTGLLAAVFLYVSITSNAGLDGSGLLPIPVLPFKIFTFLGFLGWGLQALRLALHFSINRNFVVKLPNEVTE